MKLAMNKRRRDAFWGAGLCAPAIIVLAVGLALPLVRIVYMSLSTGEGIGLDNFARVLSDKNLGAAIANSLVFTGVSVAAHLVLGLVFASLVNFDLNPHYVKIARGALIIPWAISPVVVATIFRLLYQPELSVLSGLFKSIPVMAQGILTNKSFALFAVIFINVWYAMPFYFLLFLARIQSIPKEIYEAAHLDGSTYVQSLFYISFPVLKPLIVILGIYDVVAAFNTFDLVWLTTQGGPGGATEVLATYIYRTAYRGKLDFNYAAAMGIVLLLLITAACAAVWSIGRERD